MFVNRQRELAALQRWWDDPGAHLALVRGRRRVGKTSLLQHFAQGRRSVFHTGAGRPAPAELRLLGRAAAPVVHRDLDRRHRSEVERGLGDGILPAVLAGLDDHAGAVWEEAVRSTVRLAAAERTLVDDDVVAVGEWWRDRPEPVQLDVVALAGRGRRVVAVRGESDVGDGGRRSAAGGGPASAGPRRRPRGYAPAGPGGPGTGASPGCRHAGADGGGRLPLNDAVAASARDAGRRVTGDLSDPCAVLRPSRRRRATRRRPGRPPSSWRRDAAHAGPGAAPTPEPAAGHRGHRGHRGQRRGLSRPGRAASASSGRGVSRGEARPRGRPRRR